MGKEPPKSQGGNCEYIFEAPMLFYGCFCQAPRSKKLLVSSVFIVICPQTESCHVKATICITVDIFSELLGRSCLSPLPATRHPRLHCLFALWDSRLHSTIAVHATRAENRWSFDVVMAIFLTFLTPTRGHLFWVAVEGPYLNISPG